MLRAEALNTRAVYWTQKIRDLLLPTASYELTKSGNRQYTEEIVLRVTDILAKELGLQGELVITRLITPKIYPGDSTLIPLTVVDKVPCVSPATSGSARQTKAGSIGLRPGELVRCEGHERIVLWPSLDIVVIIRQNDGQSRHRSSRRRDSKPRAEASQW